MKKQHLTKAERMAQYKGRKNRKISREVKRGMFA